MFETLSPEEQARFLDLVVTEMHDVDSDTRAVVTAWRAGDAPNWRRFSATSTNLPDALRAS